MTWLSVATNYGDAGDWIAWVIFSIMWIGIVIFGFGLLFEKIDRV